MPCPPSYEERRLVELDYSVANVSSKISAAILQLGALRQLLMSLPAENMDPETTAAMAVLESLVAPGANIFKEEHERPQDVFSMAYIESYEREEQFLIRFHERCELTLCILRTWLMHQFWENHAGFQAEFEREKALHLIHRMEEHNLNIQNMRKQLSDQEKLLALNPTFEYQVNLVQGTRTLLHRLEAVTEEELLRNRNAGRLRFT